MKTWPETALPAALLAAAVAIVYWPGFTADWVRDDFNALAFVRLLDSPWPLFVQDHFHAPAAHFRPLGYAAFWLNAALFGAGFTAQAVVEWALHVGVAIALYRLIRVGVPGRGLALLCALAFAVHPSAIGPALWYSDRFGHLATLFALIAVRAAYDYRAAPRARHLAVVLAALLAALLSKELGLVAALPITLLWWTAIARARAPLWPALLALWGTVLLYFLWRWAVLGTPASGMTGTRPLAAMLGEGMALWLANLPGYLAFWPRLDGIERALLSACALLLAVPLARALRRGSGWRADLLLTGLLLALLPGLIQAPIAVFNAMPLSAQVSAVETAMQSRLYYMSLTGGALLLSVLLGPAWAAAGRWRWLAAPAAIGLLLILALAARQTAESYRARSLEIGRTARAAVAELARHPLPAHGCRVYFLGIHHAPEWDIFVSMDAIIKALSPDLGKVAHCLVGSDSVTFMHLLPAGVAAAEGTAPYVPTRRASGPAPRRQVGNVEMLYLSPPPVFTPEAWRGTLFLANEDGVFRDVSADVLSGRRLLGK